MTTERFLAAARHVQQPREREERLSHHGIAFTVWAAGGSWFARAEGVEGFGVGESRRAW